MPASLPDSAGAMRLAGSCEALRSGVDHRTNVVPHPSSLLLQMRNSTRSYFVAPKAGWGEPVEGSNPDLLPLVFPVVAAETAA